MAQRPALTPAPDPQSVPEGNGGATKEQTIAEKKKAAAKVPPPNHPPVMNPIAPQSAHPDRPLSFQATATDPDGDPLTFSLLNNPPAGASMDGQGNFTWTPTWAQLGAYTLTPDATDTGGLSSPCPVTVPVANQAPPVDPLPNLPPAHPNQPISFQASASDPDLDPLTFALVNPPVGATIDNQGNFTWSPTWAQLGAVTITVKATDPGGLSNTRSITVTVANQAPTLDPLPAPASGHPDQPVTFTATASDPDLDPLTFALVN